METKTLISRTLMGLIAVALIVSIAACNTIEGAGKDIEKGGEHIQDAAD